MPDLNMVPSSPCVSAAAAASQRPSSSQQMPPPPAPTAAAAATSSSSINILPSNQTAVNHANVSSSLPPALPSPQFLPMAMSPPTVPGGDNSGVGPGPGPLRHPRPLTAADLHLQLEKEQEAVVNRLSREISLLRASQNASVVSTTSSTSASASASASASGTESYMNDMQQQMAAGPGFSHPTQSGRHQRTSSNASQRSLTANAGSVSTASLISGGISSPAPIRPGQAQHGFGGISLSRQNSAASRRSRGGSPSPASAAQTPGQAPGSYSSSYPHFNDSAGMASYFAQIRAPQQQQQQQPGSFSAAEMSPGTIPATSRYEETAFYRGELDSVKRENEALRRRIRELERQVRDRRASDISSRASHSNLAGAAGAAASTAEAAGTAPGTACASGGGNVVSNESWNQNHNESVSTTTGVPPPSGAASAGGLRSARGPGQRESTAQGQSTRERPRVVSMLSTASLNVGVSEEEVKVGESAASAGLR